MISSIFKTFVLSINIIAFIHCKNEVDNKAKINCSFSASLEFHTPSNTSITYKIHDFFEEKGIFVAYHYPTHALDFIDMESNKFLNKLPLESEGPDMISQVLSLYVHNLDSIFLLTQNQIICINNDGRKLLEIKVNQKNTDISGFDLEKYRIWCNPEHNQPIYYSSSQNSLYVGIKPFNTEISLENYKLPIAGRISFDSMRFHYLPIYYPEPFTKEYYGVLDNPHFLFFDDFTIAAFGAFYDLFKYDNKKLSVQALGLSSNYIQEKADYMKVNDIQSAYQDFQVMQKYFGENPRTAKLRVNRKTSMLYNLYYGPIDKDRLNYRTIGIFKMGKNGKKCSKIDEIVVSHDEYMTKIFFTLNKGLGLIDKSSTDDLLKLKIIECGQ